MIKLDLKENENYFIAVDAVPTEENPTRIEMLIQEETSQEPVVTMSFTSFEQFIAFVQSIVKTLGEIDDFIWRKQNDKYSSEKVNSENQQDSVGT